MRFETWRPCGTVHRFRAARLHRAGWRCTKYPSLHCTVYAEQLDQEAARLGQGWNLTVPRAICPAAFAMLDRGIVPAVVRCAHSGWKRGPMGLNYAVPQYSTQSPKGRSAASRSAYDSTLHFLPVPCLAMTFYQPPDAIFTVTLSRCTGQHE
ncbi:hypothetical protein VTK56DRAFT_629 [Thermocarpiscus australiensis]